MRIASSIRSTLLVLALSTVVSAPAAGEEFRPYFSFGGEKRLPECAAPSVQGAVARSFARAYDNYYDGARISDIDDIRESAYRVNGISPVARRYCHGKASFTDGSFQSVFYLIEENAGLFGVSWNVEACVSPRDKWRVYGAYCQTARPR